MVGDGGEEPAQAVVLPSGGGAEEHAPGPQALDQGEEAGVELLLSVGEQSAVDVAGDEFDHGRVLLCRREALSACAGPE